MRRLFVTLLIALSCFAPSMKASGQIRHFMRIGAGTPPAAPAEYWYVDLADEFWDGSLAPTGWSTPNTLNRSTAQLAAGTGSWANLNKSDGSASTIGFAIVNALVEARSVPPHGSGGGVFPDYVTQRGWNFANGSTVKFTGLSGSDQYTVYVHGVAFGWESGTFNFYVNGVTGTTSATINTSGNVGNNSTFPDWEDDTALAKIENITPVSGEISITVNRLSGSYTMISAIVLKKQ